MVQINMGNFGAARILIIGSSKDDLQQLATDIFFHCLRKNKKLTPKWIPREQNDDADYYSKIKATDWWVVDRECSLIY